MRIIARRTLKDFWSANPDAEKSLRSWYAEAKDANWQDPSKIKVQYGNASVLRYSRIVFNICGNKYRLIVKINYPYSTIYIRFIGSHKEYDAIDAEEI